jgi:hypothetical protein
MVGRGGQELSEIGRLDDVQVGVAHFGGATISITVGYTLWDAC